MAHESLVWSHGMSAGLKGSHAELFDVFSPAFLADPVLGSTLRDPLCRRKPQDTYGSGSYAVGFRVNPKPYNPKSTSFLETS